MLYTVVGTFLGGMLSYCYCKWKRVSFSTYNGFFSDAAMYIFVGGLVGAGAGFGYGVNALVNGNHLVYMLWKK
jgi:hypothetical protein